MSSHFEDVKLGLYFAKSEDNWRADTNRLFHSGFTESCFHQGALCGH